MPEWWDTDNARWEVEFREAVKSVAGRHLAESLARIRRLRGWQRRQPRYGVANHSWHEAELLWLEGIALERAGRALQARKVWRSLAVLYESERGREDWFLPRCDTCGARRLAFAPSWFQAARLLRGRSGRTISADALAQVARTSRGVRDVTTGESAVEQPGAPDKVRR